MEVLKSPSAADADRNHQNLESERGKNYGSTTVNIKLLNSLVLTPKQHAILNICYKINDDHQILQNSITVVQKSACCVCLP